MAAHVGDGNKAFLQSKFETVFFRNAGVKSFWCET